MHSISEQGQQVQERQAEKQQEVDPVHGNRQTQDRHRIHDNRKLHRRRRRLQLRRRLRPKMRAIQSITEPI